MYGAPGSGKSSTVQLLIKDMITEYNGLALYIDNPKLASSCLQMVRTIEPSRPIVALFEDFDSLIDEYGENEFLALLDGEAQVDNIVFVGTTNYPEELDRRFVDRPSRFDLVIQVGMPTAAARHLYLKNKEPSLTEAELKEWVEQSDGYSIAHLRELIILCKCYQYSLKDAVHRLYTMRTQKLTSANMDFGVQAKVGFLE
jgi:SpoVK/Ycf46/Vps4 family AAA+-type ATPase